MRGLVLIGVLLFWAGNVEAQVSPDQIAQIAKTVHDAERWDLGASSSRQTRNEFWARVVGIVRFGHPIYNPTPDGRWCVKDGGNGRPQSDDVVANCTTREYWDCIGGVGANGYQNNFRCNGHSDRLPPEQNIYPPPRPSDSGTVPSPTPTPAPAAVDLRPVLDALAALTAKVDALAGKPAPSVDLAPVTDRLDTISRQVDEARVEIQALASKPITVDWPEYSGRVLGTPITLRPRQ